MLRWRRTFLFKSWWYPRIIDALSKPNALTAEHAAFMEFKAAVVDFEDTARLGTKPLNDEVVIWLNLYSSELWDETRQTSKFTCCPTSLPSEILEF